jgi:carbamoylphosphate synthase large subunit
MGEGTVLFVDTGRWTCFDQFGAALRRRGIRTVRVTTETGRLSGFIARMAYDDHIVLGSLDDLPSIASTVDVRDVIDVQCTEVALSPALRMLVQAGASESVIARLRWRMDNLDKFTMSRRLSDAGIAVPRALEGSTSIDVALAAIGAPLVVKGRIGFGGSSVAIVDNADDAAAAVARFGGEEAVYFEELIHGDNVRYVSCRSDGHTLEEAVFVTSRRNPASLGPATGVRLVDDPEMTQAGRAALSAIDGIGLANVEAMKGADGVPYIIDMNLRVWGSALTLFAAGVDFVRAYSATLGAATAPVAIAGVAVVSDEYLDVFPDSAMASVEGGGVLLALTIFAIGVRRYVRPLGARYIVGVTALLGESFWHHVRRRERVRLSA